MIKFRVHTTAGATEVLAKDAKAARDQVKVPGQLVTKVKKLKAKKPRTKKVKP